MFIFTWLSNNHVTKQFNSGGKPNLVSSLEDRISPNQPLKLQYTKSQLSGYDLFNKNESKAKPYIIKISNKNRSGIMVPQW